MAGMPTAFNTPGQVLQSPISSGLGYGNSLLDQAKQDAEEKKRKAIQDAKAGVGGTPIAQSLGYMAS